MCLSTLESHQFVMRLPLSARATSKWKAHLAELATSWMFNLYHFNYYYCLNNWEEIENDLKVLEFDSIRGLGLRLMCSIMMMNSHLTDGLETTIYLFMMSSACLQILYLECVPSWFLISFTKYADNVTCVICWTFWRLEIWRCTLV